MRNHLALLLVSILSVACGSGSPTAPVDAALSFETIVKASYSGFSGPRRTAVRSDGEWVRVWQTLYAGQNPVPALPEVDFGRETVLLAAAGTRENGCFSIDITRARLTGSGSIELEVTETVPGPTCACTLALTQPVHLVRIARVSATETFVERLSQLLC